MRPVDRGANPNPTKGDFGNYIAASPYLHGRIGSYCSYCERRISANLAVEHIQPKALYPDLKGRWENFLFACVNCNSTKLDKDVLLTEFYLPDRDNTSAVFQYTPDGRIEPAGHLNPAQQKIAQKTLALTGLDKPAGQDKDENGNFVAMCRVRQRMDAILVARRSLRRLQDIRISAFQEQIVDTALKTGFFSVWMTVFKDEKEMRKRFIEAFVGTAKDCFDVNALSVSPRPENGLSHSGKI